jgi:glucose-1-phosphate adenylyltransferase
LFTNVNVGRDCRIKGSLLLPNCSVGEGCRLTNVIMDNGSHLPPGTVIGEDPDEDRERFHVMESGVVIVTRLMLGMKPGLHLRHLNPDWGK